MCFCVITVAYKVDIKRQVFRHNLEKKKNEQFKYVDYVEWVDTEI